MFIKITIAIIMKPIYTRIMIASSVPTLLMAVHNIKMFEIPSINKKNYCVYSQCKKIDTTMEPDEYFE